MANTATTNLEWLPEVAQGFEQARAQGKMVLIEVGQAPRCAGCVRLEAEVYPRDEVATLIAEHFAPVRILRSDHPQESKQFNVVWTPTLLFLEPDGTERHRIVGFLPFDDFLAQLHLGLAKAAFARDEFDASRRAFQEIVSRFPRTDAAPEAEYWAGVSGYKPNRERAALKTAAETLRDRYPNSEWAKKASVWLG
jgi:thioredoxin-related protein